MHSIKLVLVIDDTKVEGLVTKKLLEIYEFSERVDLVYSGQEGLDYLKTAAATGRPLPDLIFLDFNMPRIDGVRFLEEFSNLSHQVQYQCKVVGLSNALKPEVEDLQNDEPVIGLVSKPLTEQILEGINWKLLDLANAG